MSTRWNLILLCWFVPTWLWMAWVVSNIWGWFVTPYFEIAVPPMRVILAVDLMFSLIIHQHRPTPQNDADAAKALGRSIGSPGVILAVAWIVLKVTQ